MQTITTIGLDIAKSVFQVHGIDAEDTRKADIYRRLAGICFVPEVEVAVARCRLTRPRISRTLVSRFNTPHLFFFRSAR